MKNDTVGAGSQNGEDKLVLPAAAAEKDGNEYHQHEVPEQTEKKQAGVNLPQKRDCDMTSMGTAKFHGASGSRHPPKKRRDFPDLLHLARVADAFGNGDQETMPMELKEKIVELRGSDVKMVMEKKLTKTDLRSKFAWLSKPDNQVKNEFLTELKQENFEKGEDVLLIAPNIERSTMSLKRWKIGKKGSYVLCKEWTPFTKRYNLAEGSIIQMWSFREKGNLSLAIAKLGN